MASAGLSMRRLYVVGAVNVDTVIRVPRHPSPGETVIGESQDRRWGGKGANQAVAAALLAATKESVKLVGRVGDDAAGQEYLEHLRSVGVDVSAVGVTSGVPTGSAVIAVTPEGENTVIVVPGANAHLTPADVQRSLSPRATDVITVSLEVPVATAIEAARIAANARARMILNLSPFAALPREILEVADPVIVNEGEAEQLLENYGPLPSVLVTRGARGSEWPNVRVDAIRDVAVVDTTGAGDAYCGTPAYSLSQGSSRLKAMETATAAAARVVERFGAH